MNGNEEEFNNKEMKILARDVSPVRSPNTIPVAKNLQLEENKGSAHSAVFTEQSHRMEVHTLSKENLHPQTTAQHLICKVKRIPKASM